MEICKVGGKSAATTPQTNADGRSTLLRGALAKAGEIFLYGLPYDV
jgi:hypothetical protein